MATGVGSGSCFVVAEKKREDECSMKMKKMKNRIKLWRCMKIFPMKAQTK